MLLPLKGTASKSDEYALPAFTRSLNAASSPQYENPTMAGVGTCGGITGPPQAAGTDWCGNGADDAVKLISIGKPRASTCVVSTIPPGRPYSILSHGVVVPPKTGVAFPNGSGFGATLLLGAGVPGAYANSTRPPDGFGIFSGLPDTGEPVVVE